MTANPHLIDPTEVALVPAARGTNPLRQFLSICGEVFRRDRLALVGAIIYVIFIGVAIFAPLIAPFGPLEVVQENGLWLANEPPSSRFLLGTTNLGRGHFFHSWSSVHAPRCWSASPPRWRSP